MRHFDSDIIDLTMTSPPYHNLRKRCYMSNYEVLIHVRIFEPDKHIWKINQNAKSECTTIYCKNTNNCQLHSRGECSLIAILDSIHCLYGRKNIEIGYTKRAKAYGSTISDWKTKYKNAPSLDFYSHKMAFVGDYVFLPYSWMNMNNSVPFLQHGSTFQTGSHFLPLEHFTIFNIVNICYFRPQALIGGEIKQYQTDVVPKFIRHLSEVAPDIFQELVTEDSRIQNIIAKYSNVGRRAILQTLNPNIKELKDIHGGLWSWDGTYLTSKNSKMSFGLVKEFDEIRILPKNGVAVEVTDDNQVNKNTKFVN
jgi:hypothetical protein